MRIVKGLSEDGKTHVIQRFDGDLDIPKVEGFELEPTDDSVLVMFCDTETTGLNENNDDEVIDLGYVIFEMQKKTGNILSVRKEFEGLNEPESKEISEEIQRLTGISNEMVAGKKIDWDEVQRDLDMVQVIMAHNAVFDRQILLKYLPVDSKHWMCSFKQIPWREMGHFSAKQESLARDHGFFYSGHRALIDCKAALKILWDGHFESKCYLAFSQWDLKQDYRYYIAENSQFAFKDKLKQMGFRWYQNKNTKFWFYPGVIEDSEKSYELKNFMEDNERNGAGNLLEHKVSPKLRFATNEEIFAGF